MTLQEFNRMTPFEKQRLRERDPSLYAKLLSELNAKFPKETDHRAAAELLKKD
jgi:hypothetical protein